MKKIPNTQDFFHIRRNAQFQLCELDKEMIGAHIEQWFPIVLEIHEKNGYSRKPQALKFEFVEALFPGQRTSTGRFVITSYPAMKYEKAKPQKGHPRRIFFPSDNYSR